MVTSCHLARVTTAFGAGTAAFLNSRHRLWVRRTPEGARLAARWAAFRRYLEDFSRMDEAPVISLPLWEEFLVYGIALGVADDVLEAARFAAPPELEQTSSLYWYGSHGYSGGHSSNAIGGIERALSGAFAAPSSGGSGGVPGGTGSKAQRSRPDGQQDEKQAEQHRNRIHQRYIRPP